MRVNRRYHDLYPEMGTGPVSTEPYYSEEYYELEREYIFKKAWLNAGRVEAIPKAGDFVVKDLAVCDTSVIIVRDHDGGSARSTTCARTAATRSPTTIGQQPLVLLPLPRWTYKLER